MISLNTRTLELFFNFLLILWEFHALCFDYICLVSLHNSLRSTPTSLSTLSPCLLFWLITYCVQFMLLIYFWVWATHWSVVNLWGTLPLKKNRTLTFGSIQFVHHSSVTGGASRTPSQSVLECWCLDLIQVLCGHPQLVSSVSSGVQGPSHV